MGMYDTVLVECPNCGEEHHFQSKSGECMLQYYTLDNCPDDVLANVNRHSPYKCECGLYISVDVKTRTAYTDDEPECPECGKYCSCPEEDLYDAVADYRINHPEPSHDRHISDNPRYLLFKHMSDEHGLTLLDSEMDEISHACKLLTGADYWKQRALSAEKLIEMEPSDPKTYDEFCRLRDEWHELKNQETK